MNYKILTDKQLIEVYHANVDELVLLSKGELDSTDYCDIRKTVYDNLKDIYDELKLRKCFID